MNYSLVLPLIPALIEDGKATQTLSDLHTLATLAVPVLKNPASFATTALALQTLQVMAADGDLTKVIEAINSLASTIIQLLSNPSTNKETLAFLQGILG